MSAKDLSPLWSR